jgi:hypothetical protein
MPILVTTLRLIKDPQHVGGERPEAGSSLTNKVEEESEQTGVSVLKRAGVLTEMSIMSLASRNSYRSRSDVSFSHSESSDSTTCTPYIKSTGSTRFVPVKQPLSWTRCDLSFCNIIFALVYLYERFFDQGQCAQQDVDRLFIAVPSNMDVAVYALNDEF